MKQAFLSLLLIAAFAWVVAGKREVGASLAPLRMNRSTPVPVTADFRPSIEMDPASLGVRPDVVSPSFARQIEALQQASDLDGVNLLLPRWFQTDPEAVRYWLIQQDDLTPFQPALAAIACHLSTSGSSALALEWADLLDNPALREDTLCTILALGRRQGDFNNDALFATGLPAHRLEAILSGAEGD